MEPIGSCIICFVLRAGAETQYNQGEDGKTELSLVAFSCRHPGWQPSEPAQRQFLRSLRQSMHHALPINNPLVSIFLISFFNLLVHNMCSDSDPDTIIPHQQPVGHLALFACSLLGLERLTLNRTVPTNAFFSII